MTAEHLEHSIELRNSIIKLNLARHPAFDALAPEDFAAIYNGIGPDKWPSDLRDAMTKIYDDLEELPGVHDVDYSFSDGTTAGWKASLARWKANGSKLLDAKYPLAKFWLWRARFRAWSKIRVAYRALELFSWAAYVDAAKRSYVQAR